MPIISYLFVFALFACGCAEVRVNKVPNSSHYQSWSNEQQSKADGIEGFRFYLQRGYLSVRKPFPVSAESYLVNGTVSPDGRHILLGATTDDLRGTIKSVYLSEDQIPSAVVVPDRRPEEGPQSDTSPEKNASDENAPTSASSGPVSPEGPVVASGKTSIEAENPSGSDGNLPTTGQGSVVITTDSSKLPILPVNEYFDIVFLPDYEEQYSVTVSPGLGNATASLNYGPGDTLVGFNGSVDNSRINNFIFEQLRFLSETAQGLGLSALGLPPLASNEIGDLASSLNPAEGEAGPQSGSGADMQLIPGARVTLRVTIVDFATVGLHPIPKAREIGDILRRHFASGTTLTVEQLHDFRHKLQYKTFQYVLVENLNNHGAIGLVHTQNIDEVSSLAQELPPLDVSAALDGAILAIADTTLRNNLRSLLKATWDNDGEVPAVIVQRIEASDMPDGYDANLRSQLRESILSASEVAQIDGVSARLPIGGDQISQLVMTWFESELLPETAQINASLVGSDGDISLAINIEYLRDSLDPDETQGSLEAIWNEGLGREVSERLDVRLESRDPTPALLEGQQSG